MTYPERCRLPAFLNKGATVIANGCVALYAQYFENERHPSAADTLLRAALDAGVERSKAEAFIGDEYEDLPETKMLIREQAGNGVDSVPYVVLEGKRRDFTLVGAKEVEDYLKEFERLAKEST